MQEIPIRQEAVVRDDSKLIFTQAIKSRTVRQMESTFKISIANRKKKRPMDKYKADRIMILQSMLEK
jgi:hypothetical protein